MENACPKLETIKYQASEQEEERPIRDAHIGFLKRPQ